MKTRTKYLHVGSFVPEVQVEAPDFNEGWGPYLTLKDARRLDLVREALKNNDIQKAAKHGKVYERKLVAP